MNRIEKVAAARRIAADGMVLLRNDGRALPLAADAKVALLGVTSYCPHRMGFGSGDMLSQPQVPYDRGLVNAGVAISQPFADLYRKHIHEHADAFTRINRDWGRWTFRFPEPAISDLEFAALAGGRRKLPAIVTIGRNCGESVDMTDGPGSFRLHQEEERLLRLACENFDTVIVLLNVCGAIDASFLDRYPVKAVLLTGLAGETGGDAVADILTGRVTPSGKLAMTWAKRYLDYPTTDCFGTCDVPFNEGIYVGYRYFDTFGVEPRFPFGFGLSYTSFKIARTTIAADGPIITIAAKVTNTGSMPGAEVVQAYLSSPDGKLEKPYQQLCAYGKTEVLAPGETAKVELAFFLPQFASYCEKTASYVFEPGKYIVRVGDSSRNTHVAGVFNLSKPIVTCKTQNRLVTNDPALRLISKAGASPFGYRDEKNEIAMARTIDLCCSEIPTRVVADPAAENRAQFKRKPGKTLVTLHDVRDGKATMEQFVAQFSNEELAGCVNGIVFDDFHDDAELSGVGGVGAFQCKTRGEGSEIWHARKYGIPASNCQDGPSGVRLAIFGEDPGKDTEAACLGVAYPSATLLAQTWSKRHALEFGRCIQSDMAQANIDGWLGAGANIQRNPLCGRNFEYLSEDPLLCGMQIGIVARGVQTLDDRSLSGRYATMKHFAVNSQEYERVGENNIVSERALREIYLKSFEWCNLVGQPLAVMTSYNRINGEFAATSYDLLEGILKAEWRFGGFVMTDWWNGADPLRHNSAGNDIQMPGVREKRDAIRAALDEGRISKADVQRSVARIMRVVMLTAFAHSPRTRA